MLFFILAGVFTFLAGTLWLELSRAAPGWLRGPFLLGAAAALGYALYVIYGLDDGLVSARMFRMVLGGLCGLMFALLWRRGGSTESAEATATSASKASSAGAAGGPWWARSVGLIPVVVLVLFAYAALVPRGEINLGIIRSFKTPFIEAQFTQTQSEANLRLAIDRETQGFFRLNRAGLDEALNLARAELYYLRAMARAKGKNSEEAKAAEALEQEVTFLLTVLQPAALCVQQSFALYGSQKFLADALQQYGAGFSRAIVLAKKADPENGDGDPFARQALDELLGSIEQLKPSRLRQRHAFRAMMPEYTGNLCFRASDEVQPTLAEASPAGGGSGTLGIEAQDDVKKLDVSHRGDPREALIAFGPKAVAELIQRPSVVQGIAVFFLWSGDPGAARTILSKSSSRFYDGIRPYPDVLDLENPYPGVLYLSGFVERWLNPSSINPDGYLSLWRKTIDLFERRLAALRYDAKDEVGGCIDEKDRFPKFTFATRDLDISPQAVEQPLVDPAECGDPDQCEARLAYGYFTHFVQKLRNHVVYESARELLAKDNIPDPDVILDAALQRAENLLGFVDADGYRRGNCLILQVTRVIGGPENAEEQVTTSSVTKDYAFFQDSAGLIRYARGLEHRSDEDYTASLRLFDQALRTGADDLDEGSRAIIKEHRSNALRALGVPD